ncbi:hypothetical protein SAMN05421752_107184 [Natronorubrum thiooxidans]|uniref:DoxX protein n=2 Tax=Natronorubrum thiooxidans TaxID=308853 RepID=A0A1N7FNE2_9EURY|nr:hypothetical protein SAMN05421752_107184 [Natronorubrum thiooxidans]
MIQIGSIWTLLKTYEKYLTGRLAVAAQAHAAPVTRFAFAFVFLTFGIQKFAVPGPSPVDEPIMAVAEVGRFTTVAPASMAPIAVGIYEVVLGVCFLRNRLGMATLLFVPHHLITFLTLAIVPSIAFAPPVPFAYDTFGAFVLKNVVFVGAFLLLLAHHGYPDSSESSVSNGAIKSGSH